MTVSIALIVAIVLYVVSIVLAIYFRALSPEYFAILAIATLYIFKNVNFNR